MKHLEQFIKDNRDDFDSDQPGDRVWKNLEREFCSTSAKKPVLPIRAHRWMAAAAVVLAVITGVFYLWQQRETKVTATAVTAGIPDEYAEEVFHFTKLIELKHRELNKIRKEEPELYGKFSADIIKLDSSYQMLKQQLPGNPNEEMVLSAMIDNLRLQTELLNEQLNIIRKIKQNKKVNYDKLYKSA